MESMLQTLRKRVRELMEQQGIGAETPVTVEPLGVEEAIGDPAPYRDYPLLRGKEKLVQAEIHGAKGQAFTSSPLRWHGTLADVLALSLEGDRNGALFIAAVNALGRYAGVADDTIHCRDKAPEECSRRIAESVREEFGDVSIGIVGYQPAITNALAERFGVDRVHVVDLDPDNIGREVAGGVTIGHGDRDLETLADHCDMALATGSTIVNGTIDRVDRVFLERNIPVLYFGTTIAVPAVLLGLRRICFEGA
ncbi:MAG: hypothetical protein K9L28_04880 [Synergistales bacterium]|nr:hypothetical protein [Synergistales bacterium]